MKVDYEGVIHEFVSIGEHRYHPVPSTKTNIWRIINIFLEDSRAGREVCCNATRSKTVFSFLSFYNNRASVHNTLHFSKSEALCNFYEKSNANANGLHRDSNRPIQVSHLVSIESIESTGDITVASQFVGLLLCTVSSYHARSSRSNTHTPWRAYSAPLCQRPRVTLVSLRA